MAHLNFLVANLMLDNYLCWLDLVVRTGRDKKTLTIMFCSPVAT